MTIPSQALLFARNFFCHPYMLGSLVPSSRFLVDDVMARVDWGKAQVVVEYGPGVGTITQEILKRLRPDATLIAIELNPNFLRVLEDEIRDPRFRLVHGSALNVRQVLADLNLPNADYIISGIPFSTMPVSLRRNIAREARAALQPEGGLGGVSVHPSRTAALGIQFHLGAKGLSAVEYSSRAHFLLHSID